MKSDQHELVSVVVTTRNEERNISNCLRSIELQTWTNIEVIVIDNASSDRTKELAQEFTTAVYDRGPERSSQRNFGIIDVSRGEYALFLDADMLLCPQTIETCIDAIKQPGVVALHIDETVLGATYLSKVRRYERSFYSGTVIDGARFFRRSDFEKIGGFDCDLIAGPEDWDLDKRLKELGTIALVTSGSKQQIWEFDEFINLRGVERENTYSGIFHNESEQTLGHYLRKKNYYTNSMNAYIDKWPNDGDVKKQLGLAYRYCLVFVENGKYKKLLRHPFLATSMMFLRFLVGILFLKSRLSRRGAH